MSKKQLRREITYPDTKESEFNTRHQLGYPAKQIQCFDYLDNKRDWMKAVVAHHLNLTSPAVCDTAEMESRQLLTAGVSSSIPIAILYRPGLLSGQLRSWDQCLAAGELPGPTNTPALGLCKWYVASNTS